MVPRASVHSAEANNGVPFDLPNIIPSEDLEFVSILDIELLVFKVPLESDTAAYRRDSVSLLKQFFADIGGIGRAGGYGGVKKPRNLGGVDEV